MYFCQHAIVQNYLSIEKNMILKFEKNFTSLCCHFVVYMYNETAVSRYPGIQVMYIVLLQYHRKNGGDKPRLPLSFGSPVALIFTPVKNLLLSGWIVSTTCKFTCNIEGSSSIQLSRSRCYRLYGPWCQPCKLDLQRSVGKKNYI